MGRNERRKEEKKLMLPPNIYLPLQTIFYLLFCIKKSKKTKYPYEKKKKASILFEFMKVS